MQRGTDQDAGATRRDFLKTAAAVSAAGLAAGVYPATVLAAENGPVPLPGVQETTAMFEGLEMDLGMLSRLSDARTHFVGSERKAPEQEKGPLAHPGATIAPGTTLEMLDIDGPGAIQHLWVLPSANWRFIILRIYWDGEEAPSVEVPIGDFFGMVWGSYAPLTSPPVSVQFGGGFNCYWVMPFHKHCRMTAENIGYGPVKLAYQASYVSTEVPEDAACLHAQFRRANPQPYKEPFTILDGVKGRGHYIGTCMGWGVNNNGWWGEGEIKFYMDGDRDFPTICGTGTEDYFCGSYNFEPDWPTTGFLGHYKEYSTAYAGLHQVIRPDGTFNANTRFGLYRWHLMDPVRFSQDLRVTIQALGWRGEERYLPLKDDIASVAFWYQAEPHAPFPALPGRDDLEVI